MTSAYAAPSLESGAYKVREPALVVIFSIITLGIYFLYWTYQVFRELKEHTGQGIGPIIGLVLGIFIGIVNWFVLPSEIGNMYAAAGREAREWCDRLLEFHPAHRVDHLGGQGPERVEPCVDRRGRGLRSTPVRRLRCPRPRTRSAGRSDGGRCTPRR